MSIQDLPYKALNVAICRVQTEFGENILKTKVLNGTLFLKTILDKLTHSIKSIDTIMAMGDYSQDSGNSYRRSYRRGRDSMGRYTEGGMSSRYRDNYRDDGYSGDEYTELYETLRSLQQNTRDEGARKMVENWLKEMR